jgi:hypothetical protein
MIIDKPAFVHPRYILSTSQHHRVRSTTLKGHTYCGNYLEIDVDGSITVKASNLFPYWWNGPSPRVSLPLIGFVGTPRGPIDINNGNRVTDIPSMYHDLLYEHLDEAGFTPTRKEVDELYLELLGDFSVRWLHYFALRLFGSLYKHLVVDKHHKFVKHSHYKGIDYLD